MSRFLGIAREPVFSPGRVEDDAAILELVATRLRALGHDVMVFNGDTDVWPEPVDVSAVFAMCQGPRALDRLQQWERRGVRILNRPAAIRNCQRAYTLAAFARAGIPFPDSVLIDTGGPLEVPAWVDDGAWVKRGDVHATEADDVVKVEHAAAARDALQRFRERGIGRAVVQRHVPGTVIKFYGVAGGFFHSVPPANGKNPSAAVLRQIHELGQRGAYALQLEVYGGDCVCGVNGGLKLIDLNDWPSYAACRAGAAKAIEAYLRASDANTET